ncbi:MULTISPECIES: IS3 family transposase [Mycobacterium]|uniref:IS3 family transposase n=67 Tax=Mycobacteriaceae TaxID=1762 RepID=A0A3B6X956_MYCAV|nr:MULTISPECIES: IS3 family transposase [Mycobacterium]TXA40654.1 IS3 family transposase [Mycobacterium tuberculosis variant bovis]AXO23807.1 IS3 family transposase [Mycobacterium avium subsp. hominissuis]MBZ4503735.1 IS3 family transposase [Mycobacterium avium subsp. hominissuis]MBZ4517149.1 IS3 family transposase [Mycobacterium avium subsp. hominissuis]MBZ4523274.1 IS3 family transposase [Mycobacterium avium subsp. hominissuis]
MPKEQSPGKPTTRRYSAEEKAAAVRMVRTLRAELGTEQGTVQRVARQLGYGVESVRTWVRQVDIDEGLAPGVTTSESKKVKELEQEIRELKRANEILKRAAKFLRGGARPPTQEIVDFIDDNRGEFGVEPICTVLRSAGLQVALSTYYDAKARVPSARALRDAVLGPALCQLWKDNYCVYGARKLWKTARRDGHDVGRDQVARLMRAAGIEGVRRGKRVRTTKADPAAARHPDLVHRNFAAAAPNQLWVTDLTFVPTWAGVAYVCFIIDAHSRMIVGWRVASHMRTSMVLDALEMARWSRGTTLQDLICHSDAGSQFTSIRYGERLAEIGAVPSIGTVGDSFDNALAETVNGYYKAELIYGPARSRPWKTVEDVELATLSWVHWHNTSRLHSYLGDIPPTEFEAAFYDAYRTDQPLIGIQ